MLYKSMRQRAGDSENMEQIGVNKAGDGEVLFSKMDRMRPSLGQHMLDVVEVMSERRCPEED